MFRVFQAQLVNDLYIIHRKYAYSSKTLLMNTLNSDRINPLPSSTTYMSYNRLAQSKSMHIVPRGHIETDSSTSSYFVTLSLEYTKAPYSRYIDAKEPVGSKLLFPSPIRSRKGAYRLETSLAIDGDIKK